MRMVCEEVSVQVPIVEMRVTVIIPAVEYTTLFWLKVVEAAGVAPLPKFHAYVAPVVPVLRKFTESPVQEGAVEVKLATGV